MPRAKFHTLTEQMYYILLCLAEECCGIDIMDKVPAITGGRVSVGSGTLYNVGAVSGGRDDPGNQSGGPPPQLYSYG